MSDFKIDLDQADSGGFQDDVCDPVFHGSLVSLNLEGTPSTELGGVTFNFDASAGVEIFIFNSVDDEDKAGILGPPEADVDEDQLPPQISFREGNAWLKYQSSARLKGSAQASLDSVGLKIEGKNEAVFSDYRRHPCGRKVFEAMILDSRDLRLATNLEHIERLGDGEALAYQLRAGLKTSVKLSAFDAFTTNLLELTSLVKTDVPLTFKVKSGLTLEASIGVTDDFLVVFTRASADSYRVAIKKGRTRSKGLSGRLGVDATFADRKATRDALEELVDSALRGLTSVDPATVDEAFDKATFSDMSRLERAAVREIQKRLGLEELRNKLEEIRDRWKEFRDDVNKKIKAIAKFRVEAAFTYEFERLREDETLVQAVLGEATLARHHEKLMKANTESLMAALRADEGSVEKFLHQDKLTTSRSWGFSFGFGRFKWGAKNSKELVEVSRESFEGHKKLAYLGAREYNDSFGADRVEWKVDFNAQMPAFHPPNRGARVQDFELGIALEWKWEIDKLKRKRFESMVDLGVIWQALDEDDRHPVLDEFKDIYKKDLKTTVKVALTIPDPAFRAALDQDTFDDVEAVAGALGLAMPWWPTFEARTIAERRLLLYGDLWERYLTQEHWRSQSRQGLARFAASRLRQFSFGHKVAGAEENDSSNLTFAGQAANHPRLFNDWTDFVEGMEILRTGIAEGHDHAKIPEAFELMEEFWRHTLSVRALGILVVGAVPMEQRRHLTCSFTVDVEDEARIFVGSGHTA